MRGSIDKKVLFSSRTFLAIAIWVLMGCATSSTTQRSSVESKPAIIEAVNIASSEEEMIIVEIINSRSVPYTTFKLIDPLRIVLDVRGTPGAGLPLFTQVNDGNVTDIRVEQGNTKDMTTRVVVGLAKDVDYDVVEKGNTIRLALSPKLVPQETPKQSVPEMAMAARETEDAGGVDQAQTKPRIFFEPRPIALNQVLLLILPCCAMEKAGSR
jgi:hypothetical protein